MRERWTPSRASRTASLQRSRGRKPRRANSERGPEAEILRHSVGVEGKRGSGERAGAEGLTSSRANVSKNRSTSARRPSRARAGDARGAPAAHVACGCTRGDTRLLLSLPSRAALSAASGPSPRPRDLSARVEAKIGRDLVVAAATGVELRADVTRHLGDAPLDGGVDVLVARLEDERLRSELLTDAVERSLKRCCLLGGDPPRARPRTCALDAAMSSAARRLSKERLAERAIALAAGSPRRPSHKRHEPEPSLRRC